MTSHGAKRLAQIVELNNVSKSYGERKLTDDFTYLLKRDDRIGIIGANGAGKTTLLEIITNRIKPDDGEIEIGQTVAIGYYDQENRALDDGQRVLDYIREIAEYLRPADGNQITADKCGAILFRQRAVCDCRNPSAASAAIVSFALLMS